MPARPIVRRTALVHSRSRRIAPVTGRTLGQCFDVEVTPDVAGWTIRIPDIDATTHTRRREAVASAARARIAAHTGIPLGYIVVLIRD